MYEPKISALLFPFPTDRRPMDEIDRVGREYAAFRRLPWWRKILFWNAPKSRPLNFVELTLYTTFDDAPIFTTLRKNLYTGPGISVEEPIMFGVGRACDSGSKSQL